MTDSTDLLRCWVEFDLEADAPEPPVSGINLDGGSRRYWVLHRGIGVTGFDETDCLELIRNLLDGDDLPPIVRFERNVNVETLEIPGKLGVPVWRGVWFPPTNLEPANRPDQFLPHNAGSVRQIRQAALDRLDAMGDSPVPRITADFNYGGRRETGEGITMLNPKSGDRGRLNPRIREELTAAGFEPRDGMEIRLVEVQADLDDEGRVCDMEVDARMTVLADGAWAAIWDWDAMEWIPSQPESSS